jgi:hypothetical protein
MNTQEFIGRWKEIDRKCRFIFECDFKDSHKFHPEYSHFEFWNNLLVIHYTTSDCHGIARECEDYEINLLNMSDDELKNYLK